MPRDYDAVRSAKSMQDVGQHVFIPEHYCIEQPQELLDYITANPMCQVSCVHEGRVLSTAMPLIACQKEAGFYVGHMARRNPMAEALSRGGEVLAVFSGPEAYVSPSWFTQRQTVPTWNYLSVQLRGEWEQLTSAEDIEAVMSDTVVHMEGLLARTSQHKVWNMQAVDPDLYAGLLHGIVAFKLKPSSLEGVKRLNQDKDIRDIDSIMRGLSSSSQRHSSDIVALMQTQFAEFLSSENDAE